MRFVKFEQPDTKELVYINPRMVVSVSDDTSTRRILTRIDTVTGRHWTVKGTAENAVKRIYEEMNRTEGSDTPSKP